MYGHEAQVMLSTANVTVRSVANAVDAVITEAIRARTLKLFFMGLVSSWYQARSSSGAT
jgi:hypothetical protein